MAYDNPFAVNFIKKFEGYTPKPAWDHKQYSVGFGTKWVPGQPIGGRPEHEAALANEVGKVDGFIAQNVRVPLDDQKRAALTSFGYNLGPGAIQRLLPDINAGNWDRVGQRMLSFNKASGSVNTGLVSRRAQEAAMLTGQSNPSAYMAANAVNQVANGAPMAGSYGGSGGPVPLTPPSKRYGKLADALLASAAGAKPQGWGDLLNAAGDLTLGYTLGNKEDKAQQDYQGKLAQALMGASNETLPAQLMSSGDPALVNQGVALKVAQAKPQSQIGRYRPSKQGIVDTQTGQVIPGSEAASEAAEYGTSPQYIRDPATGKLRIGQLSKAGGIKMLDVEGDVLPGIDKIDTGTEVQLRDKRTGDVIASQPKNILGKESQEEIGKAAGGAQVALPAAKTMVENAFNTISDLRQHPGLNVGTGASTLFDPRSWLPGTNAYDFQAKNKQAQGQSFMAARDALKGAGQVTDFEGAKGEQAISNLDTAQSKEQYLSALATVEQMLQSSYQDMQKKAGMAGPAAAPAPQAAPQDQKAPVKVMSKQGFDSLPSGARFIDPEGKVRIKP